MFPCTYDPAIATDFGLGILYGSPVGDCPVSTLQGAIDALHPTAHSGLDLAAWYGVAVVPLKPCRVAATGYDDRNGNWVTVDYGDGFTSFFCHLNEPCALSVGDPVGAQDAVGYVGATGYARGPHLHWTLNRDGRIVNPLDYCRTVTEEADVLGPTKVEATDGPMIESVKQAVGALNREPGEFLSVDDGPKTITVDIPAGFRFVGAMVKE